MRVRNVGTSSRSHTDAGEERVRLLLLREQRVELAALLGLRHAVRAAGYDSVQYVSAPGFNYEIQDLRDGEGKVCRPRMGPAVL